MRNLYVDRMRGLAALMVVLSHASGYIPLMFFGLPDPLRYAISANGYSGVSIFFTVSGFLITNKILASQDATGRFSISTFYLHRAARILPCLVLMVIAGLFVATLGIERFAINWRTVPERLVYIFTFVYNVNFTSLPGAPRLWDPLWSLSVEEVFYLCFPAMLLFVRRRLALVLMLLTVVVIGPVCRAQTDSPYPYFSNFDEIAMGALAALALSTVRESSPSNLTLRVLRYGGVAIIAANFLYTRSVYHESQASLTWGPSFMGIGTAIYLIGTVKGCTNRSIAFFGLEQFGKFSYEIYLSHMFLLIGLAPFFPYPLPLVDDSLHKAIGTLWPVVVVATLLAGSYLISRFYSEPARKFIQNAYFGSKVAPSIPAE